MNGERCRKRQEAWVASVLVGLLAIFLLSACTSSPAIDSQERAVKQTIMRYNQLLADGLRAMNMSQMRQVATDLQSQDEYIYMSSMAEGGVRLDATLADLEFVKVSIETTSALVETRETWDYRHYGRVDGKLLLVEKGLVYELAYDLVRQADDRWLVSDVRAISATSTVEPQRIATPTVVPPGQ